jgi:hypothetical protein
MSMATSLPHADDDGPDTSVMYARRSPKRGAHSSTAVRTMIEHRSQINDLLGMQGVVSDQPRGRGRRARDRPVCWTEA